MAIKVPITKVCLTRGDEFALRDVIRSCWVTQGPRVEEFEELVADYVGARYAIATSSCTTALHLALITCGVGPQDEVIVPSYTFIATANAVVYCGAKPVFADIDLATYNINANKIERLINKRTKAIIAVHQVGFPAELSLIDDIAKKHKIALIEDAACALGSVYKGRKIGGISELTCFSFHPKKILTTGEGGMITTSRKDYAVLLRRLRNHGASLSDLKRHAAKNIVFEQYKELGFNYRMSDLSAALGVTQMRRIDDIVKRRIYLADRYNTAFKANSFVLLPDIPAYVRHNYQSYILRFNKIALSRNDVMEKLQYEGIATRRIMAIHLERYYHRRFRKLNLPETEKALKEAMLIPIYQQMTKKEQDFVIDTLSRLIKNE